MDTEECVPTQHFHIPVLEVEGLMPNRYRWVNGRLVGRGTRNCGVDGGSPSNVLSGIAKSGRVAMLMGGDRVTGLTGSSGILFDPGSVVDSSGSGWVCGSRSLVRILRDVSLGVVVGFFRFATVSLGFLVVKIGGGGRPSQPRSRNATTS